jgi:hypothetical protein
MQHGCVDHRDGRYPGKAGGSWKLEGGISWDDTGRTNGGFMLQSQYIFLSLEGHTEIECQAWAEIYLVAQ